jgi:hypothetical protein
VQTKTFALFSEENYQNSIICSARTFDEVNCNFGSSGGCTTIVDFREDAWLSGNVCSHTTFDECSIYTGNVCNASAFDEINCKLGPNGGCAIIDSNEDLCLNSNVCRFYTFEEVNCTIGPNGKCVTKNQTEVLSTPPDESPDDSFLFETMLSAIGNRSAALELARMPWRPATISLNQSKRALGLALQNAGGFGVPCTAAVPFLVVPGLILGTVVGVVYPEDFALAVETFRLPLLDMQSQKLVSAVTNFSSVQGRGSDKIRVEITGFALSIGRRKVSCITGTEWRFQRLGAALNESCACNANSLCSGEAICTSGLSSGDIWAVGAVSTALCKTAPSQGVGFLGGYLDHALALGLTLGLGFGLPLVIYAGYFVLVKQRKEIARVDIENAQQQLQQQPSPDAQPQEIQSAREPQSPYQPRPTEIQDQLVHFNQPIGESSAIFVLPA